jgi:acyl-CoA thioester hydrolase
MKTKVSVYRRRFRVRAYELGANGRVRDSVYLNYLQQAAVEASADVGYDLSRYDQLGTVWIIRDQSIVYLEPLHGEDEIEVKTWVSDFRRVRSHREYELRRVSDGVPVALARTDWVYLDRARLFPRRISAQAMQDFGANGLSALEAAPPLETAREIDLGPFVYRHWVPWHEQDDLSHVNNANYLNWLNQARRQALTELGLSPDDLNIAPLRYEIGYLRPAVEGDQVKISSRIVSVGQTQFTWQHEISRDGDRLVNARATLKSCPKKPLSVLLG